MSTEVTVLPDAEEQGGRLAPMSIAFGREFMAPLFAILESATIVAATVLAATGLARSAFAPAEMAIAGDPQRAALVGLILAGLYALVSHLFGQYDPDRLSTKRGGVGRVTLAWVATMAIFACCAVALRPEVGVSPIELAALALAGLVAVLVVRLTLTPSASHRLWAGILRPRRVVVVGDTAPLDGMAKVALAQKGRAVVGQFPLYANASSPAERCAELVRTLGQVIAFARSNEVDEIALALPWADEERIRLALGTLKVLPLPVHVMPDEAGRRLANGAGEAYASALTVEAQRGPLDFTDRLIKRTFDVAASGFGLLLLSPVLGVISLLIKLDSPGPVFFRQTRVGYSGRQFKIFKFRSMTCLDDGQQVRQAQRDDDRITRVGRVLRETSLDELPQLINVFLGDMSLVGPRPHALAHDVEYGEQISEYALRHHVKPGITGWAQVNGLRGATPTLDLMAQRVQHDLWYISRWSFWLDFSILVRTVFEVVRRRNAY